jgi:hypothetical protein
MTSPCSDLAVSVLANTAIQVQGIATKLREVIAANRL